ALLNDGRVRQEAGVAGKPRDSDGGDAPGTASGVGEALGSASDVGDGGALATAVATYLRPRPALAPALAAAAGGVHAMIDVSDGLVRDAGRVARRSGVAIDLKEPSGLVDEVVAAAARELGADPVPWVLAGGEDHGFLATFPPGVELPGGFVEIGRVLEGSGVTVAGERPRVSGWDHFTRPAGRRRGVSRRGT
ncbi:MAG TPA: hypothetical protein VFC82_11125, partial [Actinomycetaceae bacterium]|nr:hypothetical protein [Actinomycetaceae bacterium]